MGLAMRDDGWDFDLAPFEMAPDAASATKAEARRSPPAFRGGYRSLRFFMDRPCFALSPKRTQPITIDRKDFWLSASAGPGAGHALVHDLDVLIWGASGLTEEMNSGRELSRELTFQPAKLLRAIHRSTDGRRSYSLLEQALARLQGTTVSMIRDRDKGGRQEIFTLIERYERPMKGPWTIVVPAWFLEQVAATKILSIDPGYFGLRSPLEKCIYLWARAGVGRDEGKVTSISLGAAYARSGATGEFGKFRAKVAAIAAADELPGYALKIKDDSLVLSLRARS